MAIVWSSALDTGIDVIDQQHRRIADYINKLEQPIGGHDRIVVGQVLGEVIEYTMSHFAFEESLLEESGYKFTKPHKAVHTAFIHRLEKYQQRFDAGEDVAGELHDMLQTWLVHHIMRDDMAYVSAVCVNILDVVKGNGGWLKRSLGMFFR